MSDQHPRSEVRHPPAEAAGPTEDLGREVALVKPATLTKRDPIPDGSPDLPTPGTFFLSGWVTGALFLMLATWVGLRRGRGRGIGLPEVLLVLAATVTCLQVALGVFAEI